MSLKTERSKVEKPAIAHLVRELRQAMNLSQEKFADKLEMTFPTINRWENGHAVPSRLALKQIDGLLKELSHSPDPALRECSQALRAKYFSDKGHKA
jgi:putative transcriptional regulator